MKNLIALVVAVALGFALFKVGTMIGLY